MISGMFRISGGTDPPGTPTNHVANEERMKAPFAIIDKINGLLKVFLFILFALMLMVLTMQVMARLLLLGSLFWSEELARYIMIWMTYVGAALAMREGKLISISIMVQLLRLSERGICIVNFVACVISCGFCALITYLSIEFLGVVVNQSSPAMGLSMAIPYAAIPAGCLLMFVNAIVGFFDPKETIGSRQEVL
jgi:TRAP-type C4-dicarboxylate transport system permease small subunit